MASQYCWHVGSWDDLDHFYHNVSQSAPGSEGLVCTQFVQQCAINRALVIDPAISPISSLTSGTFFVDILYIHAGTCTTASAIQTEDFRQAARSAVQSHFRDLITWLKLYPKHLFRNCLHLRLTVWTQSPKIVSLALMCAINFTFSGLLLTSSLLENTLITHARVSPAPTSKSSLPTLIPRSMSGNTSQSTSQHCSCWLHSCILPATFTTSSSFAFLASYSLWPCLECAVSRSALMNFSSIVSFFCVSLGPWCILLRLATPHPSQLARVRIFLQSQRRIQLCGPCLVDHGRLDVFTAFHGIVHCSSSLMLSRHRSLLLESLPAGCTCGLASCVHRESSVLLNTNFHVLRADCWWSSAAHTLSARCACRAFSRARLLWSLSCKTTS